MRFLLSLLGCLLIAAAGCTTAKTSNTQRTAMEQLLISNAVDGALDKVNFAPLAGSRVYLEEKYVEGVDSKYLVGSVRHRILHAGARLVNKPEDAEVIMELRSGGVGTNISESYVGVPEVVLPGMMTLPQIRLVERSRQQGTAKIGLVAYDAKTHDILGGGGLTLAESDDSNWFVAGMGPLQTGTVRDEIDTRTTGRFSYKQQTLPQQVAFASPHAVGPEELAEDVRYASFPKESGKPAEFPVKTP
jgi:hypothetical protein